MGREAAVSDVPVPAARREGLVVTEAGEETLVYDTERHHIHRLTPAASAIWRLCDGRRSTGQIASRVAPIDSAAVLAVLTELDRCTLLVSPLPRVVPEGRLSRRRFVRRAAFAGAIAGPVIVSVSAPAAAHVSEKDSCYERCATQSDCTVGCLVCKFQQCEPDQCDNPCTDSAQCERAKAGNCTVCSGPVGVQTCQEPQDTAAAVARAA